MIRTRSKSRTKLQGKKNKKKQKISRKTASLPFDVTNWESLMKLSDKVMENRESIKYRDCDPLIKIRKPMLMIDQEIVGMKKLKNQLTQMIVKYCQEPSVPMNHLAILGPSGMGKTHLATLLAVLFLEMGKIKNPHLVMGSRTNMIGSYLGETAKMTEAVVEAAIGGVLFIDEAYSLVAGADGADSYSQSCVDTLCRLLTEYEGEFVCIIAGYKKEVEERFLKSNPGLSRRFPTRLDVEPYTASELKQIFERQLNGRTLSEDITENWFQTNMESFRKGGGSMVNLHRMVDTAHSFRVFGLTKKHKKKFVMSDMNKGFQMFKKYTMEGKEKGNEKPPDGMYL